MDIDETITQLAAKMDAWADTNLDAYSSMGQSERVKAHRTVLEIIIDLERIKVEGVTAIKTVLDNAAAAPNEQTTSLVRCFEFAAKIRNTLSDEWLDTDGVNQLVDLMDAIVSQLDSASSGRASLIPLLDHADPGIRASAGAYLINLMPDRVLPILQKVEETERANSAHFTAHWAIVGWEREGKS